MEKIVKIHDIEYIVSDDGKVYSTKDSGNSYYHKEIKQRENIDGYMVITVGKTKHRRTYSVHRLVAEAFIPNPNNLPEVNHIDCNRKNNNVSNLEWCTHQYNVQYAIDNGNHICTRDLTGANNPNFGNHILSEIYSNNPELAKEKLARHGAQNGKARSVDIIDTQTGKLMHFEYRREAAKFLIDNGFCRAKNVDSVVTKFNICFKEDKLYMRRFKIVC